MADDRDALEVFMAAALEWAAGGRGQPLVDAAAQALADGVDSPTLRVLAGAPRISADEEALELAPTVFGELGLVVAQRRSPAAYIQAARERARRLLEGEDEPGAFAGDMWRLYVNAGYPGELGAFAGINEWYRLIEDGVIAGRVDDVDEATYGAAEALVRGEGSPGGLPRTRGPSGRWRRGR